MKKQSLVTIFIPTYNQSDVLSQSIQSALDQDYPNIEILVCDDNSPDNTSEIVSPFLENKNITYIKNQENFGRVKNYKKALYSKSKGKYILCLDGDDYLCDNTYIRKAVQELEKHKSRVLVFARTNILNSNTNQVVENNTNNELSGLISGNELFLKFPNGHSLPHLTCVYRKSHAIKVGFYQHDIISSDWESLLKLILGKQVFFINKPVAVWRQHENNASSSLNIDEIIKNATMITSPYKYANDHSNLTPKELDHWRKQMLIRYFTKSLLKGYISRQFDQTKKLQAEIKEFDQEIFNYLRRNPKLMLIKLFSRQRTMLKFIVVHIANKPTFYQRFSVK